MARSTRSSAGMPSPTTPSRQTRSSHTLDLESPDELVSPPKGRSKTKGPSKPADPARTNTRSTQKRKLSQTSTSLSETSNDDEEDDAADDEDDNEDNKPAVRAPSHGLTGRSSRHKTGLRNNKHKKARLDIEPDTRSSPKNDDAEDSDNIEAADSDDEEPDERAIELMEEELLRTDPDILNDLDVDYQQQEFLERYDTGGLDLIDQSLTDLPTSDFLFDLGSTAPQDDRHVHFHEDFNPLSAATTPAQSLLPSDFAAANGLVLSTGTEPLDSGPVNTHLLFANPLPTTLMEIDQNREEGDDTEDDEAPPQINPAPHQFLLRRPSTGPAAPLDPLPPTPRRKTKTPKKKTGPKLGEFVVDPTRPYAILDGTSKILPIYPATAPGSHRRSWFRPASSRTSTIDASPRTPAASLFYESDQIASTPIDLTFGGEVNVMMSGVDQSLFDGFSTGPPEAFFADTVMTIENDVGDLVDLSDDDDEDDGEDNIDLTALIDFGDTSSEEDANMESEVETPISSSKTKPALGSRSSSTHDQGKDVKHPTRENVLAWQRRDEPSSDWYDLASNYQLSNPSRSRANTTKPVNFTSPPRKSKTPLRKAASTSPTE